MLGTAVQGWKYAATKDQSCRDSASSLQAASGGIPHCMLRIIVCLGPHSSKVERRRGCAILGPEVRQRRARAQASSALGRVGPAHGAPGHCPSLRPRLSPRACRLGEVPEPERARHRCGPVSAEGPVGGARERPGFPMLPRRLPRAGLCA